MTDVNQVINKPTKKQREVWSSIATVSDPELDESVTELGFVTSVEVVDGAEVFIQFHLPTYWCAANFAYMMATDMHQAALALPWVQSVRVELLEHMYSDTINRGIAQQCSFQETFGDEANDEELIAIRATFRSKAFQQRQELLLRKLMQCGYSVTSIVQMDKRDLLNFDPGDDEGQRLLNRYLEIRQEWVGDAATDKSAFFTVDGEALEESQFNEYLLELRRVRINSQFNGEMCRGLLQARYGGADGTATESPVNFYQTKTNSDSSIPTMVKING